MSTPLEDVQYMAKQAEKAYIKANPPAVVPAEDPHKKAAEINLRLAREAMDREELRALSIGKSPPKRMDGRGVRIIREVYRGKSRSHH